MAIGQKMYVVAKLEYFIIFCCATYQMLQVQ